MLRLRFADGHRKVALVGSKACIVYGSVADFNICLIYTDSGIGCAFIRVGCYDNEFADFDCKAASIYGAIYNDYCGVGSNIGGVGKEISFLC